MLGNLHAELARLQKSARLSVKAPLTLTKQRNLSNRRVAHETRPTASKECFID